MSLVSIWNEIIEKWVNLELEFSQQCKSLDLIIGFIVPILILCQLIWIYVAQYLALDAIFKMVSYMVASFGTGGGLIFLYFASTLAS